MFWDLKLGGNGVHVMGITSDYFLKKKLRDMLDRNYKCFCPCGEIQWGPKQKMDMKSNIYFSF